MCSRVALVVAGCIVCAPMPMAAAVQSPAGVSAIGLTFDDEFDKFVSSPNGNVGWMTAYPYEGEAARALPAPLSANKKPNSIPICQLGLIRLACMTVYSTSAPPRPRATSRMACTIRQA
jgi:hypothetical protein